MRHFENIRAGDASSEIRFCFAFNVTGEQDRSAPEARSEHDGAVVFRSALVGSRSQEGAKMHRAEHLPVAVAHQMDRHQLRGCSIEQALSTIAGESARRYPQLTDADVCHHV